MDSATALSIRSAQWNWNEILKRRQFALSHTWLSNIPGAMGHSYQWWLQELSCRNGPAAAPEFPGTSTTPASRDDLLSRNSAMALVDSSTAIHRHPVKVFGERRRHIPGFSRGTGRSLEASLFVSEKLSDQRFHGNGKIWLVVRILFVTAFFQQFRQSARSVYSVGCRLVCVVMSPTKQPIAGLCGGNRHSSAAERVTHSVCITQSFH